MLRVSLNTFWTSRHLGEDQLSSRSGASSAYQMDPYFVWIAMKEQPALCSAVSVSFALVIYLLFGFWIMVTTFLVLAGASLPAFAARRYIEANEQRKGAFRKAFEAHLLRQIGQYRGTNSANGSDLKQVCPDCSRSDCKRHQRTNANSYISEYELWMLVEIGGRLNEAIASFLDRLIDEFVRTWYDPLSEDPEFLIEVRRSSRHILAQFATRLRRVDVPRFITTRIIPLLVRHLELYNLQQSAATSQGSETTRSPTGSTYLCRYFYELVAPPENNRRKLQQMPTRLRDSMQYAALYRRRILKSGLHIALFSRYTELNYVRRLLDDLLSRTDLLPNNARTSESTLVVFREVIAVAVLVPALDALAEPQFVNTCLYKLFEPNLPDDPMNQPPPATSEPPVRLLENFAPAHVSRHDGTRALREAHFVSIDDLARSQEQLFDFMQFLKRAGAVRYLQLFLSLDELNRELFGAELSENSSRLQKFRKDLADMLVLLRERDIRAAVEATLMILEAAEAARTIVIDTDSASVETDQGPALQRLISYSSSTFSVSDTRSVTRIRSVSQLEHSTTLMFPVESSGLDDFEPCNMLASHCTYEQLVAELQRVLDSPPLAIRSLLKSFCTLRLFSVVQSFVETSCLREFNTNEAQFRRRFGAPLYQTVHFDLSDCYIQQIAAPSREATRRRRRAAAAHRSAAQKALMRQASVATTAGGSNAQPDAKSNSVNLSRSKKDREKEKDAQSVAVPLAIPIASGWSARIADAKRTELHSSNSFDFANKDEAVSMSLRQSSTALTETAAAAAAAVEPKDYRKNEREKLVVKSPKRALQTSHSLEDLLDEARSRRLPSQDAAEVRSGEMDVRSVLSARSFDARSTSPSCMNSMEEPVEPGLELKQTAMLDAFIDDFDTFDETGAEIDTDKAVVQVDLRSEGAIERRSTAPDTTVSKRSDETVSSNSSIAVGSDSFVQAADPDLGVPDLSQLAISIPCIEQRPIAKRASRKKPTGLFSLPSASLQVEEHELVAFFIIEVEYKSSQTPNISTNSNSNNRKTDSDTARAARWRVARRYFEFYQLEEKLHAFHGSSMFNGRLPARDRVLEIVRRNRSVDQQLVDRMEYFDSLRPAFESFLTTAVLNERLRNSQLLYLFLTYRHANTASAGDVYSMTMAQPQQARRPPPGSLQKTRSMDSRSLHSVHSQRATANNGATRLSPGDNEALFQSSSAEFAELFNRGESSGGTGIGWIKNRVQTSFADRKRQFIEPFLIAFARSIEPPPARPSFNRYAQQPASLERRVLNNSMFRHARWNDRFELDIIPALHALSLDEVWVADENLGDALDESISFRAPQPSVPTPLPPPKPSLKLNIDQRHVQSHGNHVTPVVESDLLVDAFSVSQITPTGLSQLTRENRLMMDSQSIALHSSVASDENEAESTGGPSNFVDYAYSVSVLPGDETQAEQARLDTRILTGSTDSTSLSNSVTVSFISASSSIFEAPRDRGENLDIQQPAVATTQVPAKNDPQPNGGETGFAELDTVDEVEAAVVKPPFDYFASFIVLFSRYFSVHPVVVSILHGLYRLDAFLSRYLFTRSLLRSFGSGSGSENETQAAAGPEASRKDNAANSQPELKETEHQASASAHAEESLSNQVFSKVTDSIASLCQANVGEPSSLVNSLVHFLIRDKLERTLYDERRLVMIVDLIKEAVFSPSPDADATRNQGIASGNNPSQADVIQLLLSFYSPILQVLTINERCYEDGVKRLIATLQDPQLNKLLSYQVLDCILLELFPELDVVVDS